MVLHLDTYRKNDGSFDHEKYRITQEVGNKNKLNNIWVQEENIEQIASYIGETLSSVQFGICHGTRRGKEQEWFVKFLGCEVIGTEISETATMFPRTIQWDFHETKPEWLESVDFIYSNSFDHSYDPEKCLNAWMKCVKPGGLCIIEHSSGHEPSGANELDPFGADLELMPYLILTWGRGRYGIRELIKARSTPPGIPRVYFIVIQRHALTSGQTT